MVGGGIAAERVVAYLAAAGVGWIAADAELHAAADRAQPDLTLVTLDVARTASSGAPGTPGAADAPLVDVLVAVGASFDEATRRCDDATRARATFWTTAGCVAALPPCPVCVAAALTPSTPPAELVALRDAFCGTVVATEAVKALLGIGVPLAGRVLVFDPTSATIERVELDSRVDCATCRRH